MKRVVMFSGGIGSWATAKRVVEQYGTADVTLLFSDVKGETEDEHIGEDPDTYRFIEDAAKNVGAELVTVKDGRDIWQVFEQNRFLGNSRLAKCSHELKQKPAKRWLKANCDPQETIVYIGIDWTEVHRVEAIVRNYQPYKAEAPMTEAPFISKEEMIAWAKSEGLKPPRLYELGFAHNNCGGGCVRAGQAQFKKLFQVMPDRFAVWEANENKMRDLLGDVSILKQTVNGQPQRLTLTQLRLRIQNQQPLFDESDFGGCGCFTDEMLGEDA
jgi:hypothetical protein